MKPKQILTVLLAAVMILSLFAACSGNNGGGGDSGNTDGSNAAPTPSGAGSVHDGSGGGDELETVNMFGFQYTSYSVGPGTVTEQVEKAINEITEREIGVHVNFTWTPLGDYTTQLTLAISNKEPIDLAHYWYRGNITAMYANGAAMDITDLIDEYAPDAKALVDWTLKLAVFDGKLYGVPAYRQLATTNYAIFRIDDLEEAGVYELAKNMTTWTELEQVLEAIKAAGTTYGLGTAAHSPTIISPGIHMAGDRFSDIQVRETLSDTLGFVYAENGKVFQLWKAEGATGGPKLVADWYEKGYIYPESAYSQDQNKTLLGMNTYAGMLVGSEYGAEANYKASTGTDCLCVPLYSAPTTGAGAKGMGAFVPASATNPTGALKLLNLMWTNKELINLYTWGIEGVTYEVADGVARYPDGVDNSNCGYHLPDYMIGNQFLVLPWDGSPSNFRDLALAYEKSAPISDYVGFAADITSIESLYASLNSVYAEYHGVLCCGLYSDAMYDEYMQKLDAAGIDEYVALYQTQLDEFMA